jgi:hypothetical protein
MATNRALVPRSARAQSSARAPITEIRLTAEPPTIDPIVAADTAQLRYVSDRMPGIKRLRAGGGFFYRGPDGQIIRDPEELLRIKSLSIPPAWTDVWICPDPNGHIQAIGYDARGRKQYIYHSRWREVRDETKFEHMLTFGRALPCIRQRVETDLNRRGLPREKVLAAVVRLMERTLGRVGNPEYAKENNSFGLTTLRDDHVRIIGGTIELDFRGKRGIQHHKVVSDPILARILKNCQELPGSELFQYIDEAGVLHHIFSGARQRISAPDFRPSHYCEGLSHLGGDEPRAAGDGRAARTQADQKGNGDSREARRRATRQHASGVPKVIHPSARAGLLPRRFTAAYACDDRSQRARTRDVGGRRGRDAPARRMACRGQQSHRSS